MSTEDRLGLEKSRSHLTRRLECKCKAEDGKPCAGQHFAIEKDHDVVDIVCQVCDERFSVEEVLKSLRLNKRFESVLEDVGETPTGTENERRKANP